MAGQAVSFAGFPSSILPVPEVPRNHVRLIQFAAAVAALSSFSILLLRARHEKRPGLRSFSGWSPGL